jgi:hypothetical protein
MPNVYGYQVLKDDTQHTVIKLTAKFDGSGQEANNYRISANSFSGALATNGFPVVNNAGYIANTALNYYGLALYRLWFDCTNSNAADVEVFWNATTPQTIAILSGVGEYDGAGNWITISNPTQGKSGSNGDIGITTRGMIANNSYTIIMELRKQNEYYSRGQFRDPAAFNYPPYGTTPGGNNGIGQ